MEGARKPAASRERSPSCHPKWLVRGQSQSRLGQLRTAQLSSHGWTPQSLQWPRDTYGRRHLARDSEGPCPAAEVSPRRGAGATAGPALTHLVPFRGGGRSGLGGRVPAPVHQDPLRMLPQPGAGLRVPPAVQGQPPPVRQEPRRPQAELPQPLQGMLAGPRASVGGRGSRAGGQHPGLSPPTQGLGQVLAVTTGPRAGDLECRAEGEVRDIPGCPRVTAKQLRRQAGPCAEPLRRPDLWLSSHGFVRILASSSARCVSPLASSAFDVSPVTGGQWQSFHNQLETWFL